MRVWDVRVRDARNVCAGITQKYLVVTCNYPARAAGVGKLMSTKEALKRCPSLVLISGEDLSPYRCGV